MNTTMVLTLVGIVLGAMTLGYGGWIAGGVIGYLAGQLEQLSKRFKKLELDIAQLKRADNGATDSVISQPSARPAVQETAVLAQTSAANAAAESPTPPPVAANAASTMAASIPSISPAPTASVAPAPVAHVPAKTTPAGPTPFDKLTEAVQRFFTEGNVIVRIGMVVMFFGLSFLVKYASNQGLLPVELRLAAVAVVAGVLIALGWKTRARAGGYGLVLQGGGVAALYLIIFAAAKIYTLMPPVVAFALMFAVVIFGVFLAVIQHAQILALMATAGGFLAPILTSDGSGSHVALFTFYLILNLGILAIAWFKTWRMLNWIGFIFTFVISVIWGILRYDPQWYFSTQPFLFAFFVLYLLLSVLFSLKQPPKLTGLVDGTLIFGLPIVAFGLQAKLLHHTEYGLAISALVLAVVYAVLARVLWLKYRATHKLLIDSFTALAVGFATLAIPLAMGAVWTSASWALEAVGLIWVGLRQGRTMSRVAGYLLHLAAAIAFISHGQLDAGSVPLLSGAFISLLVLSVSAFVIAWLLFCARDRLIEHEKQVEMIAMLIGWSWWLIAGANELYGHVGNTHLYAASILFFALSTLAILVISRVLQWSSLTHTGFWLLPLTALASAVYYVWSVFDAIGAHPAQGFGVVALLVFGAVQYRWLWQSREATRHTLLSVYHIATAWFMFCLLFWEASWWQQQNAWQGTSAIILWFAAFAAPLVGLILLQKTVARFFSHHADDYRHVVPAPLLFALLLWFIEACTYSGDVGFIYLPIVNPVDLAQLAAIVLVGWSFNKNFRELARFTPEARYGLLAGAGFVWINLVVLRAIHHFVGVDYHLPALWNSATVQMALSILWTVCALVLMNLSRRKQERLGWIIGAGLLGLVVLKLFTKDLAGSGTLAGIVSFTVVGGLMLLIGYLSPIPARRTIETSSHEQHVTPVDVEK